MSNINPISSNQRNVTDAIEERRLYEEIIKENIDYDVLVHTNPDVDIGGIVEIMLDAVCSKREYLEINRDEIPQEIVKSRFLKLDAGHIDYVIERLQKNRTKIANIRSYLLMALYNSYTTQDYYYKAEVNHDMYSNITKI